MRPQKETPGGLHSHSTTPAIIALELRQLGRLARVAQNPRRSIGDRYLALGMIHDILDAVDKRFCASYHDAIPNGLEDKSYEELTRTVTDKTLAANTGSG